MKQPNTKVEWIDNLRVLATISVIILHVSADVTSSFNKIPFSDWWIGNIYNSFTRCGVPVFVMITGALLLGKEYSPGDFFRKRFLRVIVPFLFWSTIYIVQSMVTDFNHGKNIFTTEIFSWIFDQLMHGSAFHLWYIYMLIGLYLFIPLMGKWVRHASEKEILYFLIIWGCTLFLDSPFFTSVQLEIDLTSFAGYPGYLVLGYYLANKEFKTAKINTLATIVIVAGLTTTVFGTYFSSVKEKELVETFYENLMPNVAILAAGFFLWNKNRKIANPVLRQIRDSVSKYSFGIYLSHVFFLRYIGDWGMKWDFITPVLSIPVIALLCLSLSTALIYLLYRLPFGKYIAG